jgi:hypothetical protein
MPEIQVSEEKYNRWINNCKKSKTNTSWIYLGSNRKKVYGCCYNDEWSVYFLMDTSDGGCERWNIVPE